MQRIAQKPTRQRQASPCTIRYECHRLLPPGALAAGEQGARTGCYEIGAARCRASGQYRVRLLDVIAVPTRIRSGRSHGSRHRPTRSRRCRVTPSPRQRVDVARLASRRTSDSRRCKRFAVRCFTFGIRRFSASAKRFPYTRPLRKAPACAGARANDDCGICRRGPIRLRRRCRPHTYASSAPPHYAPARGAAYQ